MSLAAVCVDRGRVIVKEPTGVRVEGRTSFVAVPSQWFKCRLFLQATTDTSDPQQSHWQSQSAPQLLCVAKDLDGVPLALQADRGVEVRSNEFGRAIWRMAGEPQPLRKKRRVIGWMANLSRVIEREYDDLLGGRVPDDVVLGPPDWRV